LSRFGRGGHSLSGEGGARMAHNASVDLALAFGDTVKRIDGSETPTRSAADQVK
jgi:hypothetical protein